MIDFKKNGNTWSLTNFGSRELCTGSAQPYVNLFHLNSLRRTYGSIRVLVIGGGDYQLINELHKFFDEDELDIQIVDPCLSEYKPYLYDMWGRSFDNCNIKEYEMIYSDYLNTSEDKGVFDVVLVDCSSPEVDIASEIYTLSFIKSLQEDIDTRGIRMFMEKDFFDELYSYIKEESIPYFICSKYIPEWEDTAYVVELDFSI